MDSTQKAINARNYINEILNSDVKVIYNYTSNVDNKKLRFIVFIYDKVVRVTNGYWDVEYERSIGEKFFSLSDKTEEDRRISSIVLDALDKRIGELL